MWFEGVSSLPKEEPEPVTINGKTYDYYSMSQKMRSMERNIRALKREREALASLGMDTKAVSSRIKSKIKEYEEFCKKCGVKPDINRLRYECGASDLTKTEAWEKIDKSVLLNKKDIAEVQEYATINASKEKKGINVTQIFDIGKIDKRILADKYGNIRTEEVIITSERVEHI